MGIVFYVEEILEVLTQMIAEDRQGTIKDGPTVKQQVVVGTKTHWRVQAPI